MNCMATCSAVLVFITEEPDVGLALYSDWFCVVVLILFRKSSMVGLVHSVQAVLSTITLSSCLFVYKVDEDESF